MYKRESVAHLHKYIYMHTKFALYFMNNKVLTNVILHCLYTSAYFWNSPTPLRIRTLVLSIHCPTLIQYTSGCWLIAYDLVFINRQIYWFRHNMNNLIKYFSLMQYCIKIYWINVLCYQFLAFIYNENYSKQKNSVLL